MPLSVIFLRNTVEEYDTNWDVIFQFGVQFLNVFADCTLTNVISSCFFFLVFCQWKTFSKFFFLSAVFWFQLNSRNSLKSWLNLFSCFLRLVQLRLYNTTENFSFCCSRKYLFNYFSCGYTLGNNSIILLAQVANDSALFVLLRPNRP